MAARGSGTAIMEKIGKYEIIRELGRGATSAVFLANDAFANRQVAIKLVRSDALGDKDHGKRFHKLFLTEASLAGKLSHPHIVSIFDAVAVRESDGPSQVRYLRSVECGGEPGGGTAQG